MTEIWRDIPGYEGRYQVSDLGRVKNRYGKVLRPQLINSGYHVVHLCSEGQRRTALIHRLVAAAFHPGDQTLEVNHIDSNKINNAASNLEWCSRLQNVAHSVSNNRRAAQGTAVVGRCLRTGAEVRFASQIAAERALSGKQSSAVHHALTGKKKSAYGYAWRVAE